VAVGGAVAVRVAVRVGVPQNTSFGRHGVGVNVAAGGPGVPVRVWVGVLVGVPHDTSLGGHAVRVAVAVGGPWVVVAVAVGQDSFAGQDVAVGEGPVVGVATTQTTENDAVAVLFPGTTSGCGESGFTVAVFTFGPEQSVTATTMLIVPRNPGAIAPLRQSITCPLAEQENPAFEVADRNVVPSGRRSRTAAAVPNWPAFVIVSVKVMTSPITAGPAGPDFAREKSYFPVGVIVGVDVLVAVAVLVAVGVGVAVLVIVAVGVTVLVAVAVLVSVGVGLMSPDPLMLPGPLIELVKSPVLPLSNGLVTSTYVTPPVRVVTICARPPAGPSSSSATQFVVGEEGSNGAWYRPKKLSPAKSPVWVKEFESLVRV